MKPDEALRILAGFRVFLVTREQAKQPEGPDLFDEAIATLAAIQSQQGATGGAESRQNRATYYESRHAVDAAMVDRATVAFVACDRPLIADGIRAALEAALAHPQAAGSTIHDLANLIPTLSAMAASGGFTVEGFLQEFGGEDPQAAGSAPGEAQRQVACERDDGLLHVHSEAETCNVCSPSTGSVASPAGYTLEMIEDAFGAVVPMPRKYFDAFRVRLAEMYPATAAGSAPVGVDAKDGARYRWLCKYPHLYCVNDLLKADQYVTVTRAVDALMACDAALEKERAE